MNLLRRYLLVLGLAILGAIIIITYQNNLSKKTDQSIRRYTQPLIDREIHGIITNKSIIDAADRIQSPNAMIYSLKVNYVDTKTAKPYYFVMNFRYQNNMAIGDTISKSKGEEILRVHKETGTVTIIPVK